MNITDSEVEEMTERELESVRKKANLEGGSSESTGEEPATEFADGPDEEGRL